MSVGQKRRVYFPFNTGCLFFLVLFSWSKLSYSEFHWFSGILETPILVCIIHLCCHVKKMLRNIPQTILQCWKPNVGVCIFPLKRRFVVRLLNSQVVIRTQEFHLAWSQFTLSALCSASFPCIKCPETKK
ncbi:hypothetical protein XELAEV_18041815mg [Xenopus laevis]|uniref:Uncharacterized protein n=1 Tax=Xenopus laevis TaxID=8355 RepID=A0A974C2R2_XENLA|nr:hypothetical protein XELAEV_18041815mg [Xenopus laevis]